MRAVVTVIALLLLSGSPAGASQNNCSSGAYSLSLQCFREFADSLTSLPGYIESIRLFRDSDQNSKSIAVATFDDKNGWQVSIFSALKGKPFSLEWNSGKLDDSFSVSYPEALSLFDLESEDGVVFEGCAPHVCPDVFSILIYVPSKRADFVATYIRGTISYSPNLDSPDNRSYKVLLKQLVNQRRVAQVPGVKSERNH